MASLVFLCWLLPDGVTDDIPVDPSNVYELLMGALSEQGRAVVKFVVDGEDALVAGTFPFLCKEEPNMLVTQACTAPL